MKQQIKWTEYVIFVCLLSALSLVWYNVYVAPLDEYRRNVAECMEDSGDLSLEGYQDCLQK